MWRSLESFLLKSASTRCTTRRFLLVSRYPWTPSTRASSSFAPETERESSGGRLTKPETRSIFRAWRRNTNLYSTLHHVGREYREPEHRAADRTGHHRLLPADIVPALAFRGQQLPRRFIAAEEEEVTRHLSSYRRRETCKQASYTLFPKYLSCQIPWSYARSLRNKDDARHLISSSNHLQFKIDRYSPWACLRPPVFAPPRASPAACTLSARSDTALERKRTRRRSQHKHCWRSSDSLRSVHLSRF